MRRSVRTLLAMTAIATLPATAAFAQASRTWVSGTGDDANPCSRTAPCKTFAGAISKTASGGEINAIDSAGYGGVTITKPITIRADGALASALVSGTNGIIINITSGTDRGVTLDGIEIEGLGTGLAGVRILSATDVTIRHCAIRNFTQAGVSIEGSDASVRVAIDESHISRSVIGISVAGTPGMSHAKVFNSLINLNATAGIRVIGAGNDALLGGNRIFGGAKGLDLRSGGAAKSYGNNAISVGDAPTSTTPLQ
jgi:hypothetical protein